MDLKSVGGGNDRNAQHIPLHANILALLRGKLTSRAVVSLQPHRLQLQLWQPRHPHQGYRDIKIKIYFDFCDGYD